MAENHRFSFEDNVKKGRITKKKSIAALILSLLFIVLGAWRGEAIVVMEKATRICMECIGIR